VNDNIYISERANNRIQVVRIEGGELITVTTFDGTGTAGGVLNFPEGIAVDDSDPLSVTVYVADRGNNRIVKLNFSNGTLSYTTQRQSSACGGLLGPSGVLVDNKRAIYVADSQHSRILKFEADKFDDEVNCPDTLGGYGITPGYMSHPEGLAIDSQDALYVGDLALGRIQRFEPISNTAPVATIVQLSSNYLGPDDVLTVNGLGQDTDGTNIIARYEWSLDKTVLPNNTGPNLTIAASELLTGPHRLSLRVQDNEDAWSISVTERIYVIPPATEWPKCEGETWTMLLYLVGDYDDDGSLRDRFKDMLFDLEDINNPCVRIAAQMDGPASIRTVISDTQRKLFAPGQFDPFINIPEQEMDAASTLTEFIAWAQKELPAKHYYLSIADHGQGIRGIGWDATTYFHLTPPPREYDTHLTSKEIAEALTDDPSDPNDPILAPIDILHLDACSMALLDVFYDLRNSARYVIASQYLGWDFFAYDKYMMRVDPLGTTQPEELARAIVQEYSNLAKGERIPYTLSVLDMNQMETIRNAMNALTVRLKAWVDIDASLTRERANLLINLRNASQILSSDNDPANTPQDDYVDLLDWATHLKDARDDINNSEITAAVTQLITLLDPTVGPSPILTNSAQSHFLFINNADIDLSRAHGLSIYFPLGKFAPPSVPVAASNSATPLFSKVYAEYIKANDRSKELFDFTRDSRWDEFLEVLLGAPAIGEDLAASPPPLAPLQVRPRIHLPMVLR
jgi:hypothetical protein